MRRHFALIAALCLALALTGCQTLSFASANDLLRAPALGEEPGAVQRALTDAKGEVEYKYPKEGDNHSPLLLVDLTGDGEEEGVVFFAREGNNSVRIAIFQKREGEWHLAGEAVGSNSEIASVETADLYGDGTAVIIVGYANSNLGGKTLELYEFDGESLKQPTGLGSYNSYLLGDFTGEGGVDLALVSSAEGDTGLRLQLISGRNGKIHYVQDDIELSNLFNTCNGIYTSTSEDGSRFLVVDAFIEANGYIGTQVLAYSEATGQFYRREIDNAALINTVNATQRRIALLASQDIDGDGVVETPVMLEYPEEEPEDSFVEEELAQSLFLIEWRDFTAEEPVDKYFGVFDLNTGLYVQMPEVWRDNVRVIATETGWRVRSAPAGRTLLEYKELAPGEEKPDNAITVRSNSEACLIYAASLNAAELLVIDAILLV